MNDGKGSLVSEWSVLLESGEGISTACVAQNDYIDESECLDKARIIIEGVKSDVVGLAEYAGDLTVDFKSNEGGEKTISSLQSSEQLKPTEIKKSLEAVSRYNERFKESTFYQYLNQYKGTVQSIDEKADVFTAYLVNLDEENDELMAEFSFKDYAFGSDRELIRTGANFIWLIGQEIEHGAVRNITKFVFRRTPVVRGKALREAKDNARKLAEFFRDIGTTETTEK
jgi:hypothetical protein